MSACIRRARSRRGWTITELLVSLGVITILFGLLLPVVVRTRESGRRTVCQSNLRQIGVAFQSYESTAGIVPRWARYDDGAPLWLEVIPPLLGLKRDFQWSELRRTAVLQCPSHPLTDIPSGYNLNVFAFETQPQWKPSPPVQLSRVRNPSSVYWILEASTAYGPSAYGPYDGIYFEPHHIVSNPQNLNQRTEHQRHRRSSNILFADGHVGEITPREFQMDRLDDGIQTRRWSE